jgi:hypothetical protein
MQLSQLLGVAGDSDDACAGLAERGSDAAAETAAGAGHQGGGTS